MSTYTPIASQTLTSTAATVTFNSIPQNFTDLRIVVLAGASASGNAFSMTFNGDTGSNYSQTELYGNGSSALSARRANQSNLVISGSRVGVVTAIQNMFTIDIQSYSNSTIFKSILNRQNDASNFTMAVVGLYRSTSAITSLTLTADITTFTAGSTFNLYGIQSGNALATKATGGNIITTDGTYWYHTFTSSGYFTPTQSLTADYLVVAGGGSGGNGNFASNTDGGGGGGAGGLRCTVGATGGGGSLETALSLSAQNYTVTVGAGGAATSVAGTNGNPGTNSTFSTIISIGGGFGGGSLGVNGRNAGIGGSGGGGGPGVTAGIGASGTANQGFAGGNASVSGRGGGGGGAGAVGATGDTTMNGGAGVSTSINGSSIAYSGGGGGGGYSGQGAGGTGGGGAGGISLSSTPGTAGTANRGGGGGGVGRDGVLTGAGGSGIVIVRYLV